MMPVTAGRMNKQVAGHLGLGEGQASLRCRDTQDVYAHLADPVRTADALKADCSPPAILT